MMKDSWYPSGLNDEKNIELFLTVSAADSYEKKPGVFSNCKDIKDVVEITDGLLAYFPLNGNLNDESGNDIISQGFDPLLTEE